MGDDKEEQIKERTYIMVKPDGVQRGLVGRIITRFEDRGLKLVGLKLLEAEDSVLDQHYEDLKDKPFYPGLIEYIKSGPVVAMVWEGQNVVQIGRNILGATNPVNAAPGTVRGDFGLEPGRNIAHGSDTTPATEDSPSSGDKEVALWFNDEELMEYERCHKDWVYAM